MGHARQESRAEVNASPGPEERVLARDPVLIPIEMRGIAGLASVVGRSFERSRFTTGAKTRPVAASEDRPLP